jgi:hypothetical protein
MYDTVRRILLAALAIVAVEIGLWATFAPQSWYDRFPGGGRDWVAVDGPYNEHLVRDVGALYLALAVVTIAALVLLRPVLVRVAALAWLVSGIPHLVYHARHLDPYGTSDKVANIVSLSLGVVAPIVLLVLEARRDRARRDTDRSVVPHAPPLEHSA